MRKDKLSLVLVAIRNKMKKVFKGEVDAIEAITLLTIAENMGLVNGKRGRDGGYLVTDKGLEFIGEDVEAFKAAEQKADDEAKTMAKARAKNEAKARKARLQASLQSVTLDKAA